MDTLMYTKNIFGNHIEIIHDELDLFNHAYEGFTFKINDKVIKSRTAKKSEKKNGLFVVLWLKNEQETNVPYDETSHVDYLLIHDQKNQGFFLFSKKILLEKGILKSKNYPGKMGFRVYTPFDTDLNATALKTSKWQTKYYHLISPKLSVNELLKD